MCFEEKLIQAHSLKRLNIFDINIRTFRAATVFVEFEADAFVRLIPIGIRLIDLCVFGQFAVRLQTTGFLLRKLVVRMDDKIVGFTHVGTILLQGVSTKFLAV